MRITALLFFVTLCGSAFAQSQLSKISFQKKDRQALVLLTQYSQEVAEGAINSKMAILGNKGEEQRALINLNKSNFFAYRGARLPKLDQVVDLYFKTETRGKKDVEESMIYLIIGKGPDDFATIEKDTLIMARAREFMNTLAPHIAAYSLELDIVNQDLLLKKLQGKIEKLTLDSVDLDKKLKGIQLKQQENSQEKAQQKSELERQKSLMEQLKKKRA